MKKTSYIIIALVVVPFILALTSPFWIRLYIYGEDKRDSHWIEASAERITEETASFNNVEFDKYGRIFLSGNTNLIIRKGDKPKVSCAENIADYVSYTIVDNTLTIKFLLEDEDDYKHIYGETVMIIETPSIDSVTGVGPRSLTMAGFDIAKATIDFDSNTYISHCNIDSLFITNAQSLSLTNSKIGYASAITSANLGVETNDSRIETMKVSTDSHMRCDISDTNIGAIQLDPNGNNIDLTFNKPITIDYVNND